ncbi:MAG: sensor histidine kinase, partial [Actinomycetota bacterium]
MIPILLLTITGVLVIGGLVSGPILRMRTIRAQLSTLGLVSVLLPASAVVAAGLVMFSAHDVAGLALVAGASALAAGGLATLMASRIAARIGRLRDAAGDLAGGDLAVRIPEEGPREVRELAGAFNEMARALGRLFETRRNLVAWASHDLRAPLASLQAMIEALEDRLAEPRSYLPEMRRQVRALSALVDDLFELSRIETGALVLDLTEVPVAELAEGCVRSIRPQAEARGVRLEFTSADRGVRARCAPDKVERILLNLITNALRHTPYDGSIAVRVSEASEGVSVAVEDTGDGLADEDLDRVFESFWRADPSRSSA